MMSSIRILVVPALAGLLSACSAFYPPDEKDDDVSRCDNVGDCDVPDNSRWDVECVHGDGQDESTPKVCAPVFRVLSCDPGDYKADHALVQKYTDAGEVNGVYVSCTAEKLGTLGCAPKPGTGCLEGTLNVLGVCDDADATYPAATASPEFAGFDVLDQFCRNYYCDSDWMCDASSAKAVCRPCNTITKDGTPGVGKGGCAEIYTRDADGAGVRSTVYVDDVSCGEDGLSPDATTAARLAAEKIGDVPEGA